MLATTNALFLRTPLVLLVWSSRVTASTGTWLAAVRAAAQWAHFWASAPCVARLLIEYSVLVIRMRFTSIVSHDLARAVHLAPTRAARCATRLRTAASWASSRPPAFSRGTASSRSRTRSTRPRCSPPPPTTLPPFSVRFSSMTLDSSSQSSSRLVPQLILEWN